VYDSWPIKLGGRSHQLYFPQKPIHLGTSHKKTMASSTTQEEDGREKNNKFLLGVIALCKA
jgi:hypothetical protein